jgi:hypothetical protein
MPPGTVCRIAKSPQRDSVPLAAELLRTKPVYPESAKWVQAHWLKT